MLLMWDGSDILLYLCKVYVLNGYLKRLQAEIILMTAMLACVWNFCKVVAISRADESLTRTV